MKMICPHCNIEMIMGFTPYFDRSSPYFGRGGYDGRMDYYKTIDGHVVTITPVACLCPKCKKIEWYAYTPKQTNTNDYNNLY